MSRERPRWYVVRERARPSRKVYARKGFGEDGTLVAVWDPMSPRGVGTRLTLTQAQKLYEVEQALPEGLDDETERRFMHELHR